LLGDVEKEKLLSVIKQFNSLYFVNVIGYCIMDNHFHLLVKTSSVEDINNEELKERLSSHNKNISNEITESELLKYKESVKGDRQTMLDMLVLSAKI